MSDHRVDTLKQYQTIKITLDTIIFLYVTKSNHNRYSDTDRKIIEMKEKNLMDQNYNDSKDVLSCPKFYRRSYEKQNITSVLDKGIVGDLVKKWTIYKKTELKTNKSYEKNLDYKIYPKKGEVLIRDINYNAKNSGSDDIQIDRKMFKMIDISAALEFHPLFSHLSLVTGILENQS